MADAILRWILRVAWMYVGAVVLRAFQMADAGDAWCVLVSCFYAVSMASIALHAERRTPEPRP